MYVTRGPDWKWGDEDGGEQKAGMVMHVDESTSLATVFWTTGSVYGHYRAGGNDGYCDLCEVIGDGAVCVAPRTSPSNRRNSQAMYADRRQTAIVLDWDDTLFPSTFVRQTLRLAPRLPLEKQRIPADAKEFCRARLQECASQVEVLLQTAHEFGKIVLVTLARKPWVTDSCANFYPGIGELLGRLGVKIVYAQEDRPQAEVAAAVKALTDDETVDFWADIKGRAIARELQEFYTLYEGQSWKNVISIGDSDFERLGTREAVRAYKTARGLQGADASDGAAKTQEVDGHVYQVRTKTIKMLDCPSSDELVVQVQMIQGWLPRLVALDDSFDADLNDVSDLEAVAQIEARIAREAPSSAKE